MRLIRFAIGMSLVRSVCSAAPVRNRRRAIPGRRSRSSPPTTKLSNRWRIFAKNAKPSPMVGAMEKNPPPAQATQVGWPIYEDAPWVKTLRDAFKRHPPDAVGGGKDPGALRARARPANAGKAGRTPELYEAPFRPQSPPILPRLLMESATDQRQLRRMRMPEDGTSGSRLSIQGKPSNRPEFSCIQIR